MVGCASSRRRPLGEMAIADNITDVEIRAAITIEADRLRMRTG